MWATIVIPRINSSWTSTKSHISWQFTIVPGAYCRYFSIAVIRPARQKLKCLIVDLSAQDKHYLCIMATDTPDQNLSQYFAVCNDFIHAARLRDGNVLIHCLAGMSRSVTVTVAYIMSVTHLSWREALKVVRTGYGERGRRFCICPAA